jgi:peptidoglycan hydrolase CwlO-like protein
MKEKIDEIKRQLKQMEKKIDVESEDIEDEKRRKVILKEKIRERDNGNDRETNGKNP